MHANPRGGGKREIRWTYSNIANIAPLLEALKLPQAHKLAELVERTHSPLASLLDAHNFNGLEDGRDTARAKGARDGARSVLQDSCDLIRLE